ncbi:MAG: class I SAM-dependent methyltransferase, partial [Elusimicrobia bacterium]|nr:class I SAM-dependent methyltransferase [Elusimicrobiota bacterium]
MSAQTDLLARVRAAGEDFEWYPTTKAMLEVVAKDIRKEIGDEYSRDDPSYSILDIGAGNGSALQILRELTKNTGEQYAIEKSRILIDALPADVFVVGTDFHEQTLIDKRVDVVFCNPPYSEYEQWMQKIVAEANCRLVYLVVPRRWKDDKIVERMIARRCGTIDDSDIDVGDDVRKAWRRSNGKIETLASMDFEHSEYREARAKIDIVKIKFQDQGYRNAELTVDPFDLWFEGTFKINADAPDEVEDSRSRAEELHDLVKGQNLIERLEELYRADLDALLGTYHELEEFDYALFKELGVDLKQVRGGLKAKIEGLKNLYWKELFGNLDAITSRLTSRSREKLLGKLTAHTSIDFTATNAYAVVVWAIKNANAYFDQQLLEVYMTLADKDNIRNYKSNMRMVSDHWRYEDKDFSHFALDYRLVIDHHKAFSGDGSYDKPNGINRRAHAFLGDICTIAKNLGFD